MTIASVLATGLFLAGAIVTYRARGWNWVAIGLALAVVLGVGGIIEGVVLRIQLTDEAMIVTDLLGSRRYARNEIVRIEEAKGVSPAILLVDGRWVKLPSAGNNLGNSVRAWLKP